MDVVGEMFSMCEFKFLDMTPQDLIKIIEYDIKQYKKKHDYYMGVAKSYSIKIEELEVKKGRLRQKLEEKTQK